MLASTDEWSVSEVLSIPTSSDLILRSIAQAVRLEGWPRAAPMQAAILRDARKSALLRMRFAPGHPELIASMEPIHASRARK